MNNQGCGWIWKWTQVVGSAGRDTPSQLPAEDPGADRATNHSSLWAAPTRTHTQAGPKCPRVAVAPSVPKCGCGSQLVHSGPGDTASGASTSHLSPAESSATSVQLTLGSTTQTCNHSCRGGR